MATKVIRAGSFEGGFGMDTGFILGFHGLGKIRALEHACRLISADTITRISLDGGETAVSLSGYSPSSAALLL